MSQPAPRFAKLAELANQRTSEGRRELLREVTEAMGQTVRPDTDLAAFDHLLTVVASDYSTQIRADLAKLIATNAQFACSAQDRKSTRLNSSHYALSRMPSYA